MPGKRNEFRIVKQDSYILSDGIHEAIISEDDWNLAKQKRNINGVKHEKIHSLEHEHILSGILKCPICGKGMYGNVNRKKKKDGTFYKDYFYYACKHRYYVNGHKCDYRKQWNEEKVNDAVAEVIKKLVNNPKFEAAIRAKINSKIDTGELETEHENLKKQLRQVLGAKNRLGQQMDNLDISDKMYDRKYQDMQDRLNGLYDEIERLESLIDDIVSRKEYIRQQKISEDGVYQYLLYFDKLYDKFTDMEKKEFMKKVIRSTNDLLLAILMAGVSIFLLSSDKIITGVENGLGGFWAQASSYITLLAGILLGLSVLQLIYAINFKGVGEHTGLHIPISKEIVITAVALVLYALLLPVLTFFPCTLVLNIVLCGTFALKENQGNEELKGKLPKKQVLSIVIYSVALTVCLWLLFTEVLKGVLP